MAAGRSASETERARSPSRSPWHTAHRVDRVVSHYPFPTAVSDWGSRNVVLCLVSLRYGGLTKRRHLPKHACRCPNHGDREAGTSSLSESHPEVEDRHEVQLLQHGRCP